MDTVIMYLIPVVRFAAVGVMFAVLWDGFDRWLARITPRLARRVVFVLVMLSLGRPVIIKRTYILLVLAYVASIVGLSGIQRFLPLNGLAQFCAQLACFLISTLVVWHKQNYLLPEKRGWAVLVFVLFFGIDWMVQRLIDGAHSLLNRIS